MQHLCGLAPRLSAHFAILMKSNIQHCRVQPDQAYDALKVNRLVQQLMRSMGTCPLCMADVNPDEAADQYSTQLRMCTVYTTTAGSRTQVSAGSFEAKAGHRARLHPGTGSLPARQSRRLLV